MSSEAGTPSVPGPYGPTGPSAWMDVDWRAHQRFVGVDGQRVNVVEIGEGEPAVVFVHGLAGSWQNWLENTPHLAAAGHRVIAFDLPGFGVSEEPGEKISIPGYGRLVDTLLDRLGVGPAVLAGNSMGGFIAAEVAIQYPARVQRLVLVSAAGLTVEYQRNERALGALRYARRLLLAWGGFVGARSDAIASRPRARRMLMRLVVHDADRLPAPLIAEQFRGAGSPGFVDALDALTDYPIRARLGEIVADADRVGHRGQARPGPRRRRVRAVDPERAQGRVGADRARADARAPGGVQRACRGVRSRGRRRGRWRRRRASQGRRRAPRQRSVIAPSEALDTSAAYFASTPVASPFSGAS
jgi:pimeloyl-ACP methyl ester carboxylesterase